MDNAWKSIAAIILAAVVFATPCGADTILLKNGNVFEGKILSESAKDVTIRITYGERGQGGSIDMTFKRKRIRRVTYSGSGLLDILKPTTVDATPDPEDEEETPAPSDETVDEEDETPDDDAAEEDADAEEPEDELDPALARQVDRYLEDLASEDQKDRDRGRLRLAALGDAVTKRLVAKLDAPENYEQRRSICRTLGDVGDKRAVRRLIDEMQGGRNDSSRMEWAYRSLKKLTGQTFPFSSDSTPARRASQLETWLDWYDSVKEQPAYADQIGYESDTPKPDEPEPTDAEDDAPDADGDDTPPDDAETTDGPDG